MILTHKGLPYVTFLIGQLKTFQEDKTVHHEFKIALAIRIHHSTPLHQQQIIVQRRHGFELMDLIDN